MIYLCFDQPRAEETEQRGLLDSETRGMFTVHVVSHVCTVFGVCLNYLNFEVGNGRLVHIILGIWSTLSYGSYVRPGKLDLLFPISARIPLQATASSFTTGCKR